MDKKEDWKDQGGYEICVRLWDIVKKERCCEPFGNAF